MIDATAMFSSASRASIAATIVSSCASYGLRRDVKWPLMRRR
jgi:hypothetical protein